MTSSGFSSNCPENQINTATAEGGQFSKKTKANRAQKWDASTCLAFAVRARTNQSRERWAQRGLEDSSESDLEVRVLLLRQLYLVRIEEEQINEALKIVDQMAQIGALRDLVEHDRARLLWAVGQKQEAIRAQRYACLLYTSDAADE
ncbi:MAG: hypothetical protein N2515_05675, partial [Deltaproteobacteria bacterium]|nr:hypothetical protein [Deltaproteobacteria bacterium]